MGYLKKFKDLRFFSALYPTLLKIIFLQKSLNYYSLKVTQFYCDSVKNKSDRTKRKQGGGVAIRHPPACLG